MIVRSAALTLVVGAAAFLAYTTFVNKPQLVRLVDGANQSPTVRDDSKNDFAARDNNVPVAAALRADSHREAHDHSRAYEITPQTQESSAEFGAASNTFDLESLLSLVAQVTEGLPEDRIREIGHQFLGRLRHSPQLLDDLLVSFDSYPNGSEKQFLKSMLVASASVIDHGRVEQYAVSRLYNDTSNDETQKSDWFAMLAETGIRSTDSRRKMLTTMSSTNEPENLRSAIRSFVPLITRLEERQYVASELHPYISHPDNQVRSAAVEVLGQWIDSSQASIIENALTDNSGDVRHAAATAALMTNVQTDKIKSSLLAIMNSESEEPDIRTQAHYALTKYSLQGDHYESFYRFHENLHEENSQ